MNEVMFYPCERCGNIVVLVKLGGGTLSCCGQDMTKLIANSTDAAKEKHVPVVTNEDGKIKVAVVSTAHPMTNEHMIEWIAFVTDKKVEIVYLTAGAEPKAEFNYFTNEDKAPFTGGIDEIVPNYEGQICNSVYSEKGKKVEIYAYCNLHGLWKVEF